jgi:flagellar motor protein MotB
VAKHNTSFKIKAVLELTLWSLKQVTAENWKRCVEHAIMEENRYAHLDKIDIPTTMDENARIIIHVNYDSEDEDDLEQPHQQPQQQQQQEQPQQQEQQQQQQEQPQQQQEQQQQPEEQMEPPQQLELEDNYWQLTDYDIHGPDHGMKKCVMCDFTTHKMQQLVQHLKTHKQCDQCDEQFGGKRASRNLKKHAKKVHNPPPPPPPPTQYECLHCGKTFPYKSYFERHSETCRKRSK